VELEAMNFLRQSNRVRLRVRAGMMASAKSGLAKREEGAGA
jgi:hypothetical protein